MAEKKIRTRKRRSSFDSQRLAGIEQSLTEMETRMDEAKRSIHKIESMMEELSKPRKRAAIRSQAVSRSERPNRPRRSLFSLFTGKRQEEEEPRKKSLLSGLTSSGFKASDLTALAEVLQNPAVQSLLKKDGSTGSSKRRRGRGKNPKTKGTNPLTGALGNMDMAQIVKLLQNPTVQAMLKNIM